MKKNFRIKTTVKCSKCGKDAQRREHKVIPEGKAYYFTEWDYCPHCRHLQHYEEFKKYNTNTKGTYARYKAEEQEQLDFFNSI